MIIKELYEGPVGDYCIARNTIKFLFFFWTFLVWAILLWTFSVLGPFGTEPFWNQAFLTLILS